MASSNASTRTTSTKAPTNSETTSLHSVSSTASTLKGADDVPSKKKGLFSFGRNSSKAKSKPSNDPASSESARKEAHSAAMATYMMYRH
jgi:hypothetical protein